jgi:hypothetical protein
MLDQPFVQLPDAVFSSALVQLDERGGERLLIHQRQTAEEPARMGSRTSGSTSSHDTP